MDHIAVLHRRLRRYTSSWPATAVRGLARYGGAATLPRRRAVGSRADRYWTLFPRAIWTAWAPARGRAAARFVDDVLWGQYCVFLFVRIHDDLLDAQAGDKNLIFIADDLLLESRRAFAAHVDTAAFRARFDRQVRTTLRAILEVDARQARPRRMDRRQLHLHARVSAIFTLGAVAACLACRRPAMIPRFEKACANLAIAAQILDDLSDVEEDLTRGRYNFVANLLGVSRPLHGAAERRERRMTRAIVREDVIGKLLELVRSYVERAAADLAPARIAEIDTYLRRWLEQLQWLRGAVHRARVAHVFPDIAIEPVATANGGRRQGVGDRPFGPSTCSGYTA